MPVMQDDAIGVDVASRHAAVDPSGVVAGNASLSCVAVKAAGLVVQRAYLGDVLRLHDVAILAQGGAEKLFCAYSEEHDEH